MIFQQDLKPLKFQKKMRAFLGVITEKNLDIVEEKVMKKWMLTICKCILIFSPFNAKKNVIKGEIVQLWSTIVKERSVKFGMTTLIKALILEVTLLIAT